MSRASVGLGWVLGGAMGLSLTGVVAVAWKMKRDASGETDAEAVFAAMVPAVERAFARDGHLCGPSLVESQSPFSFGGYRDDAAAQAAAGEEARRNVGFHCLGVEPGRQAWGRDNATYESSGDRVVVRAFRSFLYDPDGVHDRYERRGVVVAGRLVMDPWSHRVPAGGPTFPGHPSGVDPNL